jgi:hypothetical protein
VISTFAGGALLPSLFPHFIAGANLPSEVLPTQSRPQGALLGKEHRQGRSTTSDFLPLPMNPVQSSPSNYTARATGNQSESHILNSMGYDGNGVDLESSMEDLPLDPLGGQARVANEGSDTALCTFALPEPTSATSTHQAPENTNVILAYQSSELETLKDLTRVFMEHSGGSGLIIQNIIGSTLSTSLQVDWYLLASRILVSEYVSIGTTGGNMSLTPRTDTDILRSPPVLPALNEARYAPACSDHENNNTDRRRERRGNQTNDNDSTQPEAHDSRVPPSSTSGCSPVFGELSYPLLE